MKPSNDRTDKGAMTMKRLMLVWVMILCLIPMGCRTERTDWFDLHRIEEISHFVNPESTAVSSGLLRVKNHETYSEYVLADELDNGEEFEYVPTGILVTDYETGNVIYYRKADYQIPSLLGANEWTVVSDSDESVFLDTERMASWLNWASQAYCTLVGLAPDVIPELMICPDQTTCFFVIYVDFDRKSIDAMLICNLPSVENDMPQLEAYVDLKTNPECGYDGFLTASQASAAGREAIRDRFGDDAADHLIVEMNSFVLCNYGIYLDVSTDEKPDAPYEKRIINPDHPTWSFSMIDPRADLTCEDYEPKYKDTYRYHVAIDAYTGEIVILCDEPEPFAFG